jgi:hypothetical protein
MFNSTNNKLSSHLCHNSIDLQPFRCKLPWRCFLLHVADGEASLEIAKGWELVPSPSSIASRLLNKKRPIMNNITILVILVAIIIIILFSLSSHPTRTVIQYCLLGSFLSWFIFSLCSILSRLSFPFLCSIQCTFIVGFTMA